MGGHLLDFGSGVGFLAVSPEFPPCMKPVAVPVLTLAQAASLPVPFFLFLPTLWGSPKPCGVCKALDLHQTSVWGKLLGTDQLCWLGAPQTLPCPLRGSLQGTPWWIWDVGTGKRAPQLPVLSSASHLCPNPVLMQVTPVSLSPFPSVCVRLLKGRIQVSSGNAFSLLRVRARTLSCPFTVRLEPLLQGMLLPGKEAELGCTARAGG